MKNAPCKQFKADDIIIGKSAKDNALQESHDALAKAYIVLEKLCHEMAKAMDCVTAQLIRVGDDRKDAPFYEPALAILARYNHLFDREVPEMTPSEHADFTKQKIAISSDIV